MMSDRPVPQKLIRAMLENNKRQLMIDEEFHRLQLANVKHAKKVTTVDAMLAAATKPITNPNEAFIVGALTALYWLMDPEKFARPSDAEKDFGRA